MQFNPTILQRAAAFLRSNPKAGPTALRREFDLSLWTARQLAAQVRTLEECPSGGLVNPREPVFRSSLLRAVSKPTTIPDLASKLKVSEDDVRLALSDLEGRGYIIERHGVTVQRGDSVNYYSGRIVYSDHVVGEPVSFGVVSDMHMCSKSERLDVLDAAYEEFARRGIDTVICPGNYVDGECRFNKHELNAHGIADQCQYAIDHWPRRKGIKTYYIDGDDHEGWWQQREGIEFGRYLMMEAQAQGRDDLVYMGYMEADFELKAPQGSAIIKVIHAGGGSSYAYSYSSQKLAESFQGGEKPAVAIIGHYHKMEYCFPRNVHCVQAGCTQDQTRFMRKKKLAAHVGFCIVTLTQDLMGSISRFVPEFYPFWDRGYYLRRNDLASRLQGGVQ